MTIIYELRFRIDGAEQYDGDFESIAHQAVTEGSQLFRTIEAARAHAENEAKEWWRRIAADMVDEWSALRLIQLGAVHVEWNELDSGLWGTIRNLSGNRWTAVIRKHDLDAIT